MMRLKRLGNLKKKAHIQMCQLQTSTTRTMVSSNTLHRFIGAMETVYGPFQHLNDDEATHWSPPESPGAGGHRGRYLWTDAFGLVNLITLSKETSSPKYLTLAKRLAATVHDILGRTRDGLTRLPGATDEKPLAGGLRIGKLSASGSDGDGQYHHYLTLWMFALNRLSIATDDSKYNDLAIQLEKSIHPRFVFRRSSSDLRMVWKISMDMQLVLVASEGHLDAATGYVVCKLLRRTAENQGCGASCLDKEMDEYSQIMNRKGKLSPSSDTLDLGMGLWMCHFFKDEPWAADLSDKGLQFARRTLSEDSPKMMRDASQRLMFREFGACLGVSCFSPDRYLDSRVGELIKFWEKRMDQEEDDLRPISLVMYSAALIVGGESPLSPRINWFANTSSISRWIPGGYVGEET